jgi:ABC-2 family transporter
MWRQALFIARKDLQYLLLRKETLLWTFFMPIVFFYFIGTVTGGFGGGPTRERLALVVPSDAGFLADQVARRLQEQDYEVSRVAAAAEAAGFERRLELPAGFTASVLAEHQCTATLTLGDGGRGQDYDRVRVARALYTVLADLVVGRRPGEPVGPEVFTTMDQVPRTLQLEVTPAGKRRRIPTGFEQTIPGTTVMFTLLVLLTSGAVLLVAERREGLLRRLATTPIPPAAVVAGKWIGRMALGLVQIGFALLTGTVLFKMQWGPDFPAVAVVLVAYAGLNASLGLLLGSAARTEGQAVGVGVLTANVMAALGGCWWPIEITPGWMQKLSLALPTGWAMDALHRLVSFQSGAASVVPHVTVLALAALAAGWAATRIFRFE